jgi:hypothetical protein
MGRDEPPLSFLFVRFLFLDTLWHRGYISLYERNFRFRSCFRYRHRVRNAFFDCAGGHSLGGTPRLAQLGRHTACVHGLNRRCCDIHRACHRRADYGQATLDAQPHRASGINRPLYLRRSFRGLHWRVCWTISRARRHSRCCWRPRRGFRWPSVAHRPCEGAQGARLCHCAHRRRHCDRRRPIYRF